MGVQKKWTPAITFAGTDGNVTHANQQGIYVRNGNLIWVAYEIELSSKGTTSGIFPKLASLTGLPYPAETADASNLPGINTGLIFWANMTTALVYMTGTITISGQTIFLLGLSAAGATPAALVHSDFSDTTGLRGQFSYFAA